MIKRCYPKNDNKYRENVGDFWDKVFKEVTFPEYCSTLNYDEPAGYVKQYFEDQPRDMRILDVGCGGGRFLHMLAEMGFKNLSGIDLSFIGLRKGMENVAGLKCVQGSAASLPFQDQSIDAVLMVGVVYEIEDTGLHNDVFKEIKRVLKPRGRLVFVCKSPYNMGERLFTFTERNKSRDNTRFFVWRLARSDVERLSSAHGLAIRKIVKCNFGMSIYRFHYGLFVNKAAKEARISTIRKMNTYTVHDQYLANKSPEFFNMAGRLVYFLKPLFLPLFYNAEVYLINA